MLHRRVTEFAELRREEPMLHRRRRDAELRREKPAGLSLSF